MITDRYVPDSVAADTHPAAALRELGLRPRKRFSQSFLIDSGIARAAAEAADIGADEVVVEPGPGLGILTRELLRYARRVVAVELDGKLADALANRLGEIRLDVLAMDALRFDPDEQGLGDYLIVSNLPYQISSPFLSRFLLEVRPPTRMVLMLQREVAERLVAVPGNLSYLSVLVQLCANARIVRLVPSGAFFPRPRVQSALVRLDILPRTPPERGELRQALNLVRAGFAQPRKTLRNSLADGLSWEATRAAELLRNAGLEPSARPGAVTTSEWLKLWRHHAEIDVLRA